MVKGETPYESRGFVRISSIVVGCGDLD